MNRLERLEQALLPCPFCGGEAKHFTSLDHDSVDDIRFHKIICLSCGIPSVSEYGDWFEGKEDAQASQKVKARAFERWNRRSALASQPQAQEGSGDTHVDFERWLRTECFQEPPEHAYQLAKAAWKQAIKLYVTAAQVGELLGLVKRASNIFFQAVPHGEMVSSEDYNPIKAWIADAEKALAGAQSRERLLVQSRDGISRPADEGGSLRSSGFTALETVNEPVAYLEVGPLGEILRVTLKPDGFHETVPLYAHPAAAKEKP